MAALQTDSGPESLTLLLAEVREAEAQGQLPKARALLDAADASLKGYGSWHYAAGALAARAGELANAVAAFDEAVRREPEVAEFRANLGAALLEQAKAGDPAALERATRELEAACAQKPRLPNAYTNLGMARLLSGDAKGALASFDKALRMDSKDVTALYDRAAALNQLGQHRECLAALDAVLAVDPKFAPALASRAHTLARLGKS
jgi:tetratricopeptide (TPR) repeat protein